MNIRDLQYVIAVADHKHFGEAAKVCCISQPTLSMQIKKLEEELGVILFERTHKNLLITPVGEVLIKQIRQILLEVQNLEHIAQVAQDPFAGQFRLGVIPTLGPYLLPQILNPLLREWPLLKLMVEESKTEVLLEKLRTGHLEAAILALPVLDQGLVVEELFAETFYVAVSKKNALAKLKKIHLKDLAQENVLLLEEGHCLRDQALEACQISHVNQNGFKATSLETLRHLVAANLGVTLLPEFSIQHSQLNPLLAIRPFVAPQPTRKIAMLWRENTAKQTCCQAIAEFISKLVMSKVKE